jgi:hypothetical protein
MASSWLIRAQAKASAAALQRQHIGGALPDRQHLGVGQEARQHGVLDVTGAAERLERLGGDRDRLLAGGELGDRGEHAGDQLVALGGLAGLAQADELGDAEREQERALGLGGDGGDGVDVQRLVDQERAEGPALAGVVAARATARRMPAAAITAFQVRVMLSIGVMLRVPLSGSQTSSAGVPSRVSSAVGTLRVPSLSLSRLTWMPRMRPVGVAQLDVEQRQPAAAWTVALGASQGERHLRGCGGGEPLGAVEAPLPSTLRAMVSLVPTSEPPVRSVIHWPLVQKRSGSRVVSRGTARSMSGWLPVSSRVRAAPSVIASGQV